MLRLDCARDQAVRRPITARVRVIYGAGLDRYDVLCNSNLAAAIRDADCQSPRACDHPESLVRRT